MKQEHRMDQFDKLAADIAAAPSPLVLEKDWLSIQAGIKALAEWKKITDDRLVGLEAAAQRHQGD